MDNGVLPLSNIWNDKSIVYNDNVAFRNTEKAFQADDNLEHLTNGQENDTTIAQGLKKSDFHAVNVREVSCTEVCNKTRQEQKSFSISMQDVGEDLGISLREDEQPQALIEDEFINFAISGTKKDFKKQQAIHNVRIHGNEAKVQDEGVFFSLRTTKNVRSKLVKEIGRGAFGKCYHYKYYLYNGTIFNLAVKEMENKNDNSEDEGRKEYLMHIKLDHPNIVQCFWGGMNPETKFEIVMEYMCGGSVSNLLKEQKKGFDEKKIKRYTVQLLRGVEYLHSKSILHRDIKGKNLLLSEDLNVLKICDFGCATYVDCIDEGFIDTKLVGTVQFMAPEVVSRQHYSAASDMWSVGCCIIQMATGQPPWKGTRDKVLKMIGKAKSPPQVPECLSTDLQELIRKCLTIDENERITASDFLKELEKRNCCCIIC